LGHHNSSNIEVPSTKLKENYTTIVVTLLPEADKQILLEKKSANKAIVMYTQKYTKSSDGKQDRDIKAAGLDYVELANNTN